MFFLNLINLYFSLFYFMSISVLGFFKFVAKWFAFQIPKCLLENISFLFT